MSIYNKSYISDNLNLKAKIINFGNSTLEECGFNNVNILCYEPRTCESINFNNDEISDAEAGKEFKKCTSEDINEVLSKKGIRKQSNNKKSNQYPIGNRDLDQENKNKKLNSLLTVIIVCVIVNLIGLLISILLVKKKRSKRHKKSNTNVDDEFRSGSINVILNNKQSINNSYNSNVGVNNNNTNHRYSNNYHKIQKTQNILNKNNFNQNNFNQNNFNSNGRNSKIIPVRVVYIDNPHHSNSVINANSNNEATLFSTSAGGINEPPPEYTENY